ncbi:MAG: sigma-70 family RNA polymerase sigma factor [Planctomycetes bacterium]|nr:sigma-70 family RNA polymerase sigma factor [Planctomycetota bacterium]
MANALPPAASELLAQTRWVETLARSLVRDPEAARDLAQSTVLAALDRRVDVRGDGRAWLARVLRNRVRERVRRAALRVEAERRGARTEALPATDELVERAECQRRVVAAVLALDEPHRGTLLLRYFEELSPEEIARRSATPLATVTSRITRAHAKLRERLARERGDADWLAALAPLFERASSAPVPTEIFVMGSTLKGIVAVAVVGLAVWWWTSRAAPTAEVVDVGAMGDRVLATSAAATASSTLASTSAPAPRAAVESSSSVPVSAPAVETAPAPIVPPAPTGGRIFGRVFRPDGEAANERRVRLMRMGGPELFETCDAEGRFDRRELAPGVWSLASWPDEKELATLGLADEPTLGGMVYMRQRTLDLTAGAEAEVVLGAKPTDGVRVHGRVSANGKGAEGYMTWLPDGRDSMDRQQLAAYRADGGYELVLDTPGRYLVMVVVGFARSEFVVDVPRAREFDRDFELPTGVLRGVVTTAEGRPVVGAKVDLVPTGGHSPHAPAANVGFEIPTDEEGAFEFVAVAPATYALTTHGGKLDGELDAGAARRDGIVVAVGVANEDVALYVVPARAVRGRVTSDGSITPRGYVFVFDAEGRPLNPLGGVLAKGGAFELCALAPGEYAAVAACGESWSAPVEFVVPQEGAAEPIELVLAPAAKLVVDIAGREPAWIEPYDAQGRAFGAVFDMLVFNRSVNRDLSTTSFTYRLPPGEWEIALSPAIGAPRREKLTLRAGETSRLELGTR